jgi:YjjG family noncanonical pyrimidine nucleotidase
MTLEPTKKYDLILIDADETLFDFRKTEGEALARTLAAAGLDPAGPAAEAYHEINAELWRRLERGEIDQPRLRVERFRLLFERLGIGLDPRSFSDKYVAFLAAASYLLGGAEELCAYLAAKYRVVILTNGIAEVQRGRLELSPIRAFVADIVISEEAGCAKPDPAIFARALERAGLADKSRSIMIGDSLSSDIRGAVGFGIDSCWVNFSGAPNDTGLRPTYEVRSLAGITEIL